jgi:hypothetical protein
VFGFTFYFFFFWERSGGQAQRAGSLYGRSSHLDLTIELSTFRVPRDLPATLLFSAWYTSLMIQQKFMVFLTVPVGAELLQGEKSSPGSGGIGMRGNTLGRNKMVRGLCGCEITNNRYSWINTLLPQSYPGGGFSDDDEGIDRIETRKRTAAVMALG